jgi:broad specificity phosphatase PhoE
MKFTLVTHGEVQAAPGPAGRADPALTTLGRRQAAALAEQLLRAAEAGNPVEAIYTSPLRAARLTAEALSAVLDAGDPRVASELSALAPEQLDGDRIPDAEAVQERAWALLLDLKPHFEPQSTVVLVTHEITVRSLVCRALEMPLAEMRRFDLDPASVTTIEFRLQRDRERTLIAALNDTCHVETV